MYGNNQDTTKKSFGNYLKSLDLSQKTFKNYLSDINHFSVWIADKLKTHGTYIEGLTDAIPFLNRELAEEYKSQMHLNGVPVKSINRRLSTLRKLAEYLLMDAELPVNFMDKVGNFALSTAKRDYDAVIKDFLSFLSSNKATPNTLKNYLSDIRHFISWTSEQYPEAALWDAITVKNVMAYGEFLKPRFSHSSQKRKAASISKFFDWSQGIGFISQNPFKVKAESLSPVAPEEAPLGYQTWTFMAISLLFAFIAVRTVMLNFVNFNSNKSAQGNKARTVKVEQPAHGSGGGITLPLSDSNPETNMPMIFITADIALNPSDSILGSKTNLIDPESDSSSIYLYTTKYNNSLTNVNVKQNSVPAYINPLHLTNLKGRGVLNAYLIAKGLTSGDIQLVQPGTTAEGIYINSIDKLFASAEYATVDPTNIALKDAYSVSASGEGFKINLDPGLIN
jgi:site-specific recombinase XerD